MLKATGESRRRNPSAKMPAVRGRNRPIGRSVKRSSGGIHLSPDSSGGGPISFAESDRLPLRPAAFDYVPQMLVRNSLVGNHGGTDS